MAIEKNSFKVTRLDTEVSSRSRESMSSDNDELQRRVDSDEDDDDEFDDCDSGAGSDDYDLLELGEVGEEFCQVGDQTLSIPFELYDLQGLGDVLSMDVWNDCLTEDERFSLTKYLPDMDQENYMRTLKELFIGENLHFGSPIAKLFDMMKGGLTEPRVALYRQGLNSFQKRQHYHLLRKHQNSMVASLYQIKDAWHNCKGYGIEERLRVLNIQKSQKSMMYENMEELESDSSERDESGEGLWGKKMKDKDRKRDPKSSGRHSAYGSNPSMDLPSRGRAMSSQQEKLGKQNPKGTLKLGGSKMSSAKEFGNHSTFLHHGQELGHYGSPLAALPRQHMAAVNDLGASAWMRDHMKDAMAKESMYEVAVQRDQSLSRISAPLKAGGSKMGKKHDLSGNEYASGSYMCLPNSTMNDIHGYGGNKTVNKLSDIKVLTTKPSNSRSSYDYSGRLKYPEASQIYPVDEPMKYGRNRVNNLAGKGSWNEFPEGTESLRYGKTHVDAFPVDPSLNYSNRGDKNKKWIAEREPSDLKANRFSQFQSRANPLDEKFRSIATQNGGQGMLTLRGSTRYAEGEETESDSSEEIDEDDEDDNPLMRSKQAYPREVLEASFMKSGLDPKRAIPSKRSKKHNVRQVDVLADPSNKMADIGQHDMPEIQNLSLKGKRKDKTPDADYLHNSAARVMESMFLSGSGRLDGVDDQSPVYKLGKNGRLPGEYTKSFHLPPFRALLPDRGQKGEFGHNDYAYQSNYMQGYIVDDGDSLGARRLGGEKEVIGRAGKKSKDMEVTAAGYFHPSSLSKKWKVKEEVMTYEERDESDFLPSKDSQYQLDDVSFTKMRGKRKLNDDADNVDFRSSEPSVLETGTEEVEPEPEPPRKPFILITPTVHTGFSFSVVHLLSAIRMAMTTLLPEDSLEIEKRLAKSDGGEKLTEDEDIKQEGTNGVHSEENTDSNKPEQPLPTNVPSLTVHDIVNRVRSNPGDPCILETQEPLQDLVRGVLKILSSKTAPLGAKGWKPLVMYQKSTKTWYWIGPASHSSSDHEAIEEVTSPEAWGLPHKVLVKLVDAFANWLKSGQETLQQIGSLPAPPLSLMQFNLDEKERFRDLRAQKSLSTIGPSPDEVRDYFRKEEILRYSIPDRAFSYTALDGRKSIVAPLRRCGGKPTSKARDHHMLKRDRPPHVTILCLVRDAAARLPGSIGTRADVCTLLRDSQFIVEDVPDAQLNQIVSGAMDRLHYERDPCVQFDGERKLWVYLHREREEEDFEDDGTSSTKKWKRQKKDNSEAFEQETVTEADNEAGGNGYDLSSDLNVEASCMDEDKRMGLMYYDDAHNVEDNAETSHGSEQGAHLMAWESLGVNSMPDNRLLCQENSNTEEFAGGPFDREPLAELLSTSLS